MVRPCSSPASERSRLGAPKIGAHHVSVGSKAVENGRGESPAPVGLAPEADRNSLRRRRSRIAITGNGDFILLTLAIRTNQRNWRASRGYLGSLAPIIAGTFP